MVEVLAVAVEVEEMVEVLVAATAAVVVVVILHVVCNSNHARGRKSLSPSFLLGVRQKRPQSGLSDKANCTSSHEPHPSEKRPVANDALTEKSASETSPLRRQKCVSRLCALHAQF